MDTIIVANAPDFRAAPFGAQLRRAGLLIAADGGGNALADIGIIPHVLIGDFDSLRPEVVAACSAAGAELLRHPPEKDETDLELALLLAIARGATRIDVLGALGGRWDQGLANVALLAMPELAGCQVRLLDLSQEAYLVRDSAAIAGAVGDTVSLLPMNGPAHGITTSGLSYPLSNATLYFERARGVSNVITAVPAQVRLTHGLLLIVRQKAEQTSASIVGSHS